VRGSGVRRANPYARCRGAVAAVQIVHDDLLLRIQPQSAQSLAGRRNAVVCDEIAFGHREYNATLVISKLDRLSRDAAWLMGLERQGYNFVIASSPNVNRLAIGVLALVAEQERRDISIRTKGPSLNNRVIRLAASAR
jgi:Resolvase, N terminal domain